MRAWVATTLDGEDGLRLQDLPNPPCGADQVRIANQAAALNFPDVLVTRGQYQLRLDPPFVPGSECAGVVIEVGSDVEAVTVGDRVLTVCGVGAFAEEIVVTPSLQQVHVIPDDMTLAEAAGFGMVYGTALHGLRQQDPANGRYAPSTVISDPAVWVDASGRKYTAAPTISSGRPTRPSAV
jgi:NADPH2:quinone reductase